MIFGWIFTLIGLFILVPYLSVGFLFIPSDIRDVNPDET